MNKKYYLILILFSGVLFFQSCENVLEFKGEAVEPQLVLSGFITPDSLIKIHLSESVFFLNNKDKFDFVNNASVSAWKNGVLIEQLSGIGNGHYISTFRPEVGDFIEITASNPSFDQINCNTDIVKANPIISTDTINYIYYESPNGEGEYDENSGMYIVTDTIGYYISETFGLSLKFNDPKEESNYYRVVVSVRNWYDNGTYADKSLYLDSDDIIFGSSEGDFLDIGEYSYYNEFSDKLFNGSEYTVNFDLNYSMNYFNKNYIDGIFNESPEGYYGEYFEIPESRELIVELQSLSRPYYMYLSTLSKSKSMDDEMSGLFSEPVQIYSNVIGGIGILGSYTSSVHKIKLRQVGEGSNRNPVYY